MPQNKTFSKTVLLCLLLMAFSACDPGQRILIQNRTDAKAIVTFIFKPGSQHYRFEESGVSDTLIVTLDSTKENSAKAYYFGIGHWAIPGSLDSLVSMVDMVEIQTWKSKETFRGATQIRNFFKSRISGRKKETIEIRLE